MRDHTANFILQFIDTALPMNKCHFFMKFIPPSFNVEDVEIRQLRTNEIIGALRLLHDVYISERGWLPPLLNKSGLQILRDDNGAYLHDSLVEKAAWFGALHNGRVIGCFRVLVHPFSELDHYILLPDMISCAPASELNRLAFVKEWRGRQDILLALLRAAFDYAFSITPIVYTTAETGKYSKLYKRLGLLSCDYPPFKYDAKDALPAEILYFDSGIASRYSTLLYRFTDHLVAESGEAALERIRIVA